MFVCASHQHKITSTGGSLFKVSCKASGWFSFPRHPKASKGHLFRVYCVKLTTEISQLKRSPRQSLLKCVLHCSGCLFTSEFLKVHHQGHTRDHTTITEIVSKASSRQGWRSELRTNGQRGSACCEGSSFLRFVEFFCRDHFSEALWQPQKYLFLSKQGRENVFRVHSRGGVLKLHCVKVTVGLCKPCEKTLLCDPLGSFERRRHITCRSPQNSP